MTEQEKMWGHPRDCTRQVICCLICGRLSVIAASQRLDWRHSSPTQATTLVIPKPALSARNLLAAGSHTADSSRDSAALRNDNPLEMFQTASPFNTLCECVHWAKLFSPRSAFVIGSKGVLMRRGLYALVCLLLLTSFSISQDTPITQSAPAPSPTNPNPAPAKQRLKIGVALEG